MPTANSALCDRQGGCQHLKLVHAHGAGAALVLLLASKAAGLMAPMYFKQVGIREPSPNCPPSVCPDAQHDDSTWLLAGMSFGHCLVTKQ